MQEETTTNYCKTSLDEATRYLCVCYNNYNHLQTVCPEQGDMEGETTAVIGEKLLRICACATAIINTIHLLPVFVQNRVTCKEKQWQ